jgi:toxin-antitoxin system PIN domain toxin
LKTIRFLLDVNVLLALTEPGHIHHRQAMKWFSQAELDWGMCPFTEAGFLRVSTNGRASSYSMDDAEQVLAGFSTLPGYRFWPITAGWSEMVRPFRRSIFGHQQVTDAYLLGIAIHGDGVLVTFDKAIRHLAGERYQKHVMVLE